MNVVFTLPDEAMDAEFLADAFWWATLFVAGAGAVWVVSLLLRPRSRPNADLADRTTLNAD